MSHSSLSDVEESLQEDAERYSALIMDINFPHVPLFESSTLTRVQQRAVEDLSLIASRFKASKVRL